MDWTAPYSYSLQLTRLTDEWADGEQVARITDATVDRDATDDAPTLESCDVIIAASAPTAFSGWARLDAIVKQRGGVERQQLGCYRFEPDSAKWENGGYTVSLTGYSVLKPLEEATMPVGAYAAYGCNVASWAASLMAANGVPSPIEADATAQLGKNIVFEDDVTVLEAVWQALGEAGLRLFLDGDGTVHIAAEPSQPALSIDRTDAHGAQGTVEVKTGELSYTREFDPATRVGDLVRVDLPSLGINGTYRSASQSIDLASGLTVEETLEAWNG